MFLVIVLSMLMVVMIAATIAVSAVMSLTTLNNLTTIIEEARMEYQECPECGSMKEVKFSSEGVYLYCDECEIEFVLCPDCGDWIDLCSGEWLYTKKQCVWCEE